MDYFFCLESCRIKSSCDFFYMLFHLASQLATHSIGDLYLNKFEVIEKDITVTGCQFSKFLLLVFNNKYFLTFFFIIFLIILFFSQRFLFLILSIFCTIQMCDGDGGQKKLQNYVLQNFFLLTQLCRTLIFLYVFYFVSMMYILILLKSQVDFSTIQTSY